MRLSYKQRCDASLSVLVLGMGCGPSQAAKVRFCSQAILVWCMVQDVRMPLPGPIRAPSLLTHHLPDPTSLSIRSSFVYVHAKGVRT